jgi:hypothetical protein
MQKGEEKKAEATANALKNLDSLSDFKFHKMSPE